MRLVVILLVLVVLPTALLSVLAGRSIQAREVILHRRLEQAAIQQINGAREAFGALLQLAQLDARPRGARGVGMNLTDELQQIGKAGLVLDQ